MENEKAFTLIELLVVVLIIGILAAVALPQYQKAVAKSRASTIIPVGQAIWQAKESYYMANGEYVRDINVLDIDVPTNCTYLGWSGYYACGEYFLLDNNLTNVTMNYCPVHLTDLAVCRAHQDFRLVWSSLQQPEGSAYQAGERYCVVHNNSKLGQEVCKNLAGFTYGVYTDATNPV